jgi:hypothetical protein
LKFRHINSQRNYLDDSLIHTAFKEVQHSNRVKAEFREPKNKNFVLGKLFMSFDIEKKLQEMYSSFNSIREEHNEED